MRAGGAFRTSPEVAAAREAEKERVRSQHNISDVFAKAGIALTRAGSELKALCPYHTEKTPSMRVRDEKGSFYCFGCGASGDIFRAVQDLFGLSFLEAMNWLGADNLPPIDPTVRAKRRAKEEADRTLDVQAARAFFADAEAVSGQGLAYLRARCLTMAAPPTIRFGMVPSWQNPETRAWGRKRPALVCGLQNVEGAITGVQRIFVDGPELGKAACKLTLGRIRFSALRLGPVQSEITVTEGPEDAYTLAQGLPGRSIWASCGTGLLPFIEFPPAVDSVLIAGQNNDAGRRAVEAAGEAYLSRGLSVREMYPHPDFDDWNDELRGRK